MLHDGDVAKLNAARRAKDVISRTDTYSVLDAMTIVIKDITRETTRAEARKIVMLLNAVWHWPEYTQEQAQQPDPLALQLIEQIRGRQCAYFDTLIKDCIDGEGHDQVDTLLTGLDIFSKERLFKPPSDWINHLPRSDEKSEPGSLGEYSALLDHEEGAAQDQNHREGHGEHSWNAMPRRSWSPSTSTTASPRDVIYDERPVHNDGLAPTRNIPNLCDSTSWTSLFDV